MLWIPVDFGISRNKRFFLKRCPDIPGSFGIVEKWRFATPAKRVSVDYPLAAVEQARFPFLEVFENKRVSFLDKLTGKTRISAGHLAI